MAADVRSLNAQRDRDQRRRDNSIFEQADRVRRDLDGKQSNSAKQR